MKMGFPDSRTILSLQLMMLGIYCQNITLPGYTKWDVPSSPRDDMYCADRCLSQPDYNRCCGCEALPCWQINATACGVSIGYLSLEYVNIFGSTIIIDANFNNSDIHILEFANERMTELPINICDFNATLNYIDLSFNRIENVDSIRCLTKLDTLLLSNNQIRSIDNTTFSQMELLRVLSFANNEIEVLDPNTISVPFANIFFVNFSGNSLVQTDITNIFREGHFCSLSYENCDLGNITNINNLQVDPVKDYGPGDTYMNNTNIGQLFDFTSLGITDYSSVALFLKGQLHINAASIHCDCSIVPLFRGMGDDILNYWPNLGKPEGFAFTCQSPPSMKGVDLEEVYKSGDFGNLTCGIVVNCTDGCTCTDKPSDDIVIVDCRNRSLQSMPELLPIGRFNNPNVRLLLDNNNIHFLDDRDYLDRIKYLQMPLNPLNNVDDSAANKLISSELININNQRLNILPRYLSKMDPNKIEFGSHPVQCGCDNLWIGNWMRAYGAKGLFCQTDDGVRAAQDVSVDSLKCLEAINNILRNISIILGSFAFFLLLIALTIKFKTEIALIKRRLFSSQQKPDPAVFLSMCEDNDEVFALIHYCVRPSLQFLDLTVKTTWYDCPYGEDRQAYLSTTASISDVFVVFLCDMYLNTQQSMEEFDIIWKAFLQDKTKNIIIVNWDSLDTSDINDRRIRALVRTGYAIQFDNFDVRLMKRIALKVNNNLDAETIPEKFMTFSRDKQPAEVDTEEDSTKEAKANDEEIMEHENKPVHERLNVPKGEKLCKCKYRKCYVHMYNTGDTSFYD